MGLLIFYVISIFILYDKFVNRDYHKILDYKLELLTPDAEKEIYISNKNNIYTD